MSKKKNKNKDNGKDGKVKNPNVSDNLMRSYPLKHHMNSGKEQTVLSLFSQYQKTCESIQAVQWRLFFQSGRMDKNNPVKGDDIKSKLSERYKQTAQYQV